MIAEGVGSADLLLMDANGEVKGSAAAEVRMPTRVKLFATAISALEDVDFAGETPRPQILAGGTASFLVQYLDGDLALQGSTPLKLAMQPTIVAEVLESPLMDSRDVLQITVGDPGRDTIELWLGKQLLDTVDVEAVSPYQVVTGRTSLGPFVENNSTGCGALLSRILGLIAIRGSRTCRCARSQLASSATARRLAGCLKASTASASIRICSGTGPSNISPMR